jgi:hypothetical protein
MSNFEDFDSEDDDQQTETNPMRARMKQLEKENREYKKVLAETQQAAKELAFVKAGINLDNPMAKYFVKGYDGELTPEAIRAAGEEAQLITPQTTVMDSDRQGWQTTNRIAAGSETAPPPPSWAARINEANSESELIAIFAEAQAQGLDLNNL